MLLRSLVVQVVGRAASAASAGRDILRHRLSGTGVALGGTDPIGKGAFNNSLGLMYDSTRKLIWTVGQYSQVSVLRLDPATVNRKELK